MKKIKININIEHEIDDNWYEDEKLTPKQKLRKYEEDFSDLEVLVNLLDDIKYDWNVKAEYK